MSSLSTSPSRFEDRPKLQRIERILAWTTGVILLLVGLIYAGVRGHYAFVHKPAVQTYFQDQASVPFPAVTFCPLFEGVPPLQLLECVRETGPVEDTDCRSTAYYRNFIIETEQHYCLTINDPQNGGSPIAATSVDDEMGTIISINSSLVPAGEPIGAIVMLHDQGTNPYIEPQNAFIIDVGKLTDIWVRKDQYTALNGTVTVFWTAYTSVASIQPASAGAPNTMDMDFVFPKLGTYMNQEYYIYTQDNWIGEVGGLCALLLFLHAAFNFLVMLILSRVYKDDRGQRLNDTTQ